MNIKDLKYLIAVAEHQHFGKAADACFVSQPALSIQIKKLETKLGAQLIERSNKSVILTDIGHTVVSKAQKIIADVDALQHAAKLTDPFAGQFKLGIFPTLAPYLLPLIIPKLTKAFPQLSIYLIEEQTAELLSKLKAGKIDAAFLALPITDNQLATTELFDEEFVLATPPKHALAKKANVKQSDLANQTLLLLEQGHCLRDQALDVCQLAAAQEADHFRATSLETLRHMVAAGIGMTLIPELARDTNKQIAYLPFQQPKPKRTIGLVTRKTFARQTLLDTLLKELKAMKICG